MYIWSVYSLTGYGNKYILKVNNNYFSSRSGMCLKLAVKTPEYRNGVFIVNFEHILHLFLVFLFLFSNR